MNTPIKLALILPCFNEQEVLLNTYQKLNSFFASLIDSNLILNDSIICFVDDGSNDGTWNIISEVQTKNEQVQGIKLSRNFGHQNALIAGLTSLSNNYDCYITIDADLQDDISAIEKMVLEYNKGNSIVYGVRSTRSSDSISKRTSARFFYKLMTLLGVNTIPNHADFRLLSNQVLNELLEFKEVNLFLRGIVPLLGFSSSKVYYERLKREEGETKYPFSKMISFAWEGITSFTIKPMRFILILGIVTFLFSISLSIWSVVSYFKGLTIPGWFSMIFPLILLSGIQMISIGILGEYIGKMFLEIKKRPRFIVEKYIKK